MPNAFLLERMAVDCDALAVDAVGIDAEVAQQARKDTSSLRDAGTPARSASRAPGRVRAPAVRSGWRYGRSGAGGERSVIRTLPPVPVAVAAGLASARTGVVYPLVLVLPGAFNATGSRRPFCRLMLNHLYRLQLSRYLKLVRLPR